MGYIKDLRQSIVDKVENIVVSETVNDRISIHAPTEGDIEAYTEELKRIGIFKK